MYGSTKKRRLFKILILIAGIGLLLTTFIPFLPYIFGGY